MFLNTPLSLHLITQPLLNCGYMLPRLVVSDCEHRYQAFVVPCYSWLKQMYIFMDFSIESVVDTTIPPKCELDMEWRNFPPPHTTWWVWEPHVLNIFLRKFSEISTKTLGMCVRAHAHVSAWSELISGILFWTLIQLTPDTATTNPTIWKHIFLAVFSHKTYRLVHRHRAVE